MPALCAARVKQQIVEVPKNKIVITLGSTETGIFVRGIYLEKDLAIHQQSEKFESGKVVLPAEAFDLPRCSKHNQGSRNLWIDNFEQRPGARRLQHHLVASPP